MKLLTTVLAIIGAVIMALSGIVKLVSSSFRSDMVSAYEIGGNEFPGWFFVLVGLAEILIAIWLLYPPFRDAGGVGMFIVMIGALIFNLALVKDVLPSGIDDPSGFAFLNIVLALLGAAVAFLWPRVEPWIANSRGWAYTDGDGYGPDDNAVIAEPSVANKDMNIRDGDLDLNEPEAASAGRGASRAASPGRKPNDPIKPKDMNIR